MITAVAALSLALGIGVNTAIFSVFERLLLRPLPVPTPATLVNITSPGPRPGSTSTDGGDGSDVFSYPLARDLERIEVPGLSRIAAYSGIGANIVVGAESVAADALLVSGSYFQVLGVAPAAGRVLTPDDDRAIGAHPVAVLGYTLWTTRFGSDPTVVGRTIVVNGVAMTVVGVTESRFRGTRTMEAPQMFAPLAMATQLRPGWSGLDRRNDHWLYAFARLRSGVTRADAARQLNVPFASLIRDVEFPVQRSGMSDRARAAFLARKIVLEDGSRGRNPSARQTRLLLSMMLSLTALVLLIACTNVANLLLAKTIGRFAEMGTRLSLGASMGRLVRLLATEALLLGVAGALGGVAVAYLTVLSLLDLLPIDDRPLLAFDLNLTVLAFTLALGVGAAVVFGVAPVLHLRRARLAGALNAGSNRQSAPRSATRVRTVLAATQIAFATALLAFAGLFVVTLANLTRAELGLRPEGLVTFRLSPVLNGYSAERARALFARTTRELYGVAGVTAVSTSSNPVLSDSAWTNNVTVEGFTPGADDDTKASTANVGPDYFRTLGIAVLAGRDFREGDDRGSAKVAIINEAFARKFHLGSNALGKRMALGAGGNRPLDIQIVGVVRDAAYSHVRDIPPAQFFRPFGQIPDAAVGTLTFYVRSRPGLPIAPGAIARIVQNLDPALSVEKFRTMPEQVVENITAERMVATLTSVFAGLATVLAGVGLYGLLAYMISQRVQEIGIRMALGARPIDVRRLVLTYIGRVWVIGGAIGLAAAVGLGHLASSMLYGIGAANPAVIIGAAVAIAIVTFTVGAFPARQAAGVDPIVALRGE